MPKNTLKKRSITDTMFGWAVLAPASLFTIATVVTAIDINPVVYSPLALPITLSVMASSMVVFTAVAMFIGSCMGMFCGLFSTRANKPSASSNTATSTPDNSNTATLIQRPLITPHRAASLTISDNTIAAARTADDPLPSIPSRAVAKVFGV